MNRWHWVLGVSAVAVFAWLVGETVWPRPGVVVATQTATVTPLADAQAESPGGMNPRGPSPGAAPGDRPTRRFKSSCDSPEYSAIAMLRSASREEVEAMGPLDALQAARQHVLAKERAIGLLDTLTSHPQLHVRMAAWRFRLAIQEDLLFGAADSASFLAQLGRAPFRIGYSAQARERTLTELRAQLESAPADRTATWWFAQLCSTLAAGGEGGPAACHGADLRWARMQPASGWAWLVVAEQELRQGDTQAADAALHRAALAPWSSGGIPDPRAEVLARLPADTPAAEYALLLDIMVGIQAAQPWLLMGRGKVVERCAAADANDRLVCQRVAHQMLAGAPSPLDRVHATTLLQRSGAPVEALERSRAETRRLMEVSAQEPESRAASHCARFDQDLARLAEQWAAAEIDDLNARLGQSRPSVARP